MRRDIRLRVPWRPLPFCKVSQIDNSATEKKSPVILSTIAQTLQTVCLIYGLAVVAILMEEYESAGIDYRTMNGNQVSSDMGTALVRLLDSGEMITSILGAGEGVIGNLIKFLTQKENAETPSGRVYRLEEVLDKRAYYREKKVEIYIDRIYHAKMAIGHTKAKVIQIEKNIVLFRESPETFEGTEDEYRVHMKHLAEKHAYYVGHYHQLQNWILEAEKDIVETYLQEDHRLHQLQENAKHSYRSLENEIRHITRLLNHMCGLVQALRMVDHRIPDENKFIQYNEFVKNACALEEVENHQGAETLNDSQLAFYNKALSDIKVSYARKFSEVDISISSLKAVFDLNSGELPQWKPND